MNPKGYWITGTTTEHNIVVEKEIKTELTLCVKGGNIKAKAGYHSPGIGGACTTSVASIEGGMGEGGSYGPAIGSVCVSYLKNIVISGGDTLVIAKGDEVSKAPGIGKTDYAGFTIPTTLERVTASPNSGYQGYVQDGESMENYTFMEGTPFKTETDIRVGKFYAVVYFGQFRDKNTVEPTTNEQIGANHVISKTGGKEFTKEQLKELTKVNARDKSGNLLSADQIRFVREDQTEASNKAKGAGKTGDYPLTFCTANGTEVTVQIYLRKDGTDVAPIDPDASVPTIGANDFEKDTGGEGFTEEQLKLFGELKGKDRDGTTIDLDGFAVDQDQMERLNKAKTSGEAGIFDLTYTSSAGAEVTVQATLVKYDAIGENDGSDTSEIIKGMDVVSRTGGDPFSEEQLKDLTMVKAFDKSGNQILTEELKFSDPDQLEQINAAKTEGKTGNFKLTMKTSEGTKVTVQVYLRDSGSDSTQYDPEKTSSFLAANNAVHETGGEGFTKSQQGRYQNLAGYL